MKRWIALAVVPAVLIAGSATAASLVTSADIKNGTIKTKDLNRRTVNKLKGQRGPAGPQGPQGPQGAQGPQGVQGPPGPVNTTPLTKVTAVKTLAPGAIDGQLAECPAGQRVVSGGYSMISGGAESFLDRPSDGDTAWFAAFDNYSTTTGDLTVYAYCASTGRAIAAGSRPAPKAELEAQIAKYRAAQ